MAALGERIGLPLMAWQQLVADVGGEIDPRTGLPAYREVAVTVPRQSGKTLLILMWMLQRVLGWGKPQLVVYSAQTGKDAREKLLDDLVPLLEPHRKALGLRRVIRTNGSEKISFVNGSRIILLTGMADAGHGKTVDLAIKDEFFADVDDRRDQALIPAMMTRADAQVLTFSTMGTDESVPLNRKIEQGRLAAGSGARSGLAYFEWSADADADPDDPATWWSCMPALGYTVTEEVVRHARITLTDSEFRRAFLNQLTKSEERVIPAPAWDGVCNPNVAPTGPLVFSVDVSRERTAGSIVAASTGARPTVELVDYRAGTGWVVPRAKELHERHDPALWVVDGAGPAGSLVADLEAAGLPVHPVTSRELIEACARFYDAVIDRQVFIRRHPRLDEAAASAAKRLVGDAWAWTRKAASADISPLVAATLAVWGATRPEGTSVYEPGGSGLVVL